MISPLFVCHGGPTLVIEKNEYTDFLKELGKIESKGYCNIYSSLEKRKLQQFQLLKTLMK